MASSRRRSLRCLVTGHRWVQAEGDERHDLVLRCRRCSCQREISFGSVAMSALAEREGRRGAELGGLAPTRFRR